MTAVAPTSTEDGRVPEHHLTGLNAHDARTVRHPCRVSEEELFAPPRDEDKRSVQLFTYKEKRRKLGGRLLIGLEVSGTFFASGHEVGTRALALDMGEHRALPR